LKRRVSISRKRPDKVFTLYRRQSPNIQSCWQRSVIALHGGYRCLGTGKSDLLA
jgi:hypothetical protein